MADEAIETKTEDTAVVAATRTIADPNVVTLAASELKAINDELAAFRKAEAAKVSEARVKADAAAAEKGKYDEIIERMKADQAAKDQEIAARDAKLATLEKETADTFIGKELATALSLDNLMPGSSKQLAKLWRDEFVAKREGGVWVVKTRDGKTPEAFVAEQLATAEYAMHVKAASRSGAGSDATGAAAQKTGAAGELTPVQKIKANLEASKTMHGGRGMNFPVLASNN